MSTNPIDEALYNRDGAGQDQRSLPLLDPKEVPIDPRSTTDLLRFARRFSERVYFYNSENQISGTWDQFLSGNPAEYAHLTPADQEALRDAWLEEAATYYENPAAWEGPQEQLSDFSRPHFSLFMAFLQLTSHIRSQLNSLTGIHLDYFYRQALGLTRQEALPDHLNITVQLADDIDQFLLEKGAKLNAGKDSEGKDLIYETIEDVVLTKAQVDELRTVYVERDYLSAETYHRRYLPEATLAFERLLRLPYGQPLPGDPLPPFNWNGPLTFNEATLISAGGRLDDLGTQIGLNIDLLIVLAEIAESELGIEYHALRWQTLILAPELEFDLADNSILLWGDRVEKEEVQARAQLKIEEPNIAAALAEAREILSNLYLRAEDLKLILDVQARQQAALAEEEFPDWTPVYDLLNQAWLTREAERRQEELFSYFNSDAAGPANDPENPVTSEEALRIRFNNLVAFALGEPGGPGQFLLLQYNSLDEIASELARQSEAAELYIAEELRLSNLEFTRLLAIRDDSSIQNTDRRDMLSLIERAQSEKNNVSMNPPQVEEWNNVYSFADATQNLSNVEIGVEENDPRWKAFGAPQKDSASDPEHSARIGFALSTPLLEMHEGERRVNLFLSFKNGSAVLPAMQELLSEAEEGNPFFRFLFSSGENWLSPKSVDIDFGGYLKYGAGKAIDVQIKPEDEQFAAGPGLTFTVEYNNALILWTDGKVYKITYIGRADRVSYQEETSIEYQGPPLQVKAEDLLLGSMKIELYLDQQLPAVTAPVEETEDFVAGGGFPVLRILLNDQPYTDPETGATLFRKRYQRLRSLELQRVFIEVNAAGLRNFLAQNDYQSLDPSKPFEPFGDEPVKGNGFYITHPEIAAKRLQEFSLNLDWLDAPASFRDYYYNYDLVDLDVTALPADTDPLIQSNLGFQVRMALYDQREILLDTADSPSFPLFSASDASLPHRINIDRIPEKIESQRPGYRYVSLETDAAAEEEEALDWPRYIRLELQAPDFQHTRYSLLSVAQGYNKPDTADYTGTQSLRLNDPYIPLLKSMQLAYRSQLDLTVSTLDTNEARLIHLHPFGFAPVQGEEAYLLPQYLEEGALYMGLSEVNPPDTLQVLFQMAEGSANPDLKKAPISWAFLQNNQWKSFGDADIVSDRTNGLLRSGIIKFKIPAGATSENTLLPAGKTWLRATVDSNSDSVSDVISIRAQAVEAVFVDDDNAEDHLGKPLPGGSITGTVDAISELSEVEQPYPSSSGKAAESDLSFYTRISERLRHKQRAIAAWDYERLTLEQFPDIFKAKCLPNNPYDPQMEPGLVRMVVIPDIIGRFPFNPYQPKVPAEKLVEIREYLEEYMPPYAELQVVNPSYLQINVRVAVKFLDGYNEGFYKAQLEEDLRRYLAPWAYQEGEDIVLGGKIYANVIVNFIEERPYIDFVGRINLFQSSDGKKFQDSSLFNKPGDQDANVVRADAPEMVLVSALHHDVEVISEGSFRKELEQGIGHARIEVDFYIGGNA